MAARRINQRPVTQALSTVSQSALELVTGRTDGADDGDGNGVEDYSYLPGVFEEDGNEHT